jgi:hypothetical protein
VGDEPVEVLAVVLRLDLAHRAGKPLHVRKLEDGLEVAVLDHALRALLVERRDRRGEADSCHAVAQLQCDCQCVRATARVTGDDEPTELQGVGDRFDVGHPVEDAAMLVGGGPADTRSVGGHESDAQSGRDRVIRILAEARVAGAVLEEHRDAVGVSDDLVRDVSTARDFEHRHSLLLTRCCRAP